MTDRRTAHPLWFCVSWTVLFACGEPLPPVQVVPVAGYSVVGVGKLQNDGLVTDGLTTFSLRLDDVNLTTDGFSASVTGPADPVSVTGSWVDDERKLTAQPFFAALTSTNTEQVEQFGGRVDPLASGQAEGRSLTGFIRTRLGARVIDGTLIGVDASTQVAEPANVTATLIGVGDIEIVGTAGPNLAVEVFNFNLRDRDPELSLATADGNGRFQTTVRGVRDNIILVRTKAGLELSPAVSVRVQ